ncbi:MAG: efflux RND transporter permease subunit [Candidatus Omnitrophota bacterium]
MNIPKFSVRQNLFVNLLSILILIGGTVALFTLKKEAFPTASFDMVTISTVYPSASPEEVEKLITTPIEKELDEVDGVEEILSNSFENLSYITVKIDPDTKNKNKVTNDIQQAVDRVMDLPKDAEDPLVFEVTTKQIPIIEIALSGEMSEPELQRYADAMEDRIRDIEGVASVDKKGYRNREIWVEVFPEKINLYRVSLEEIMSALAKRNIGISAGKLTRADKEFRVRTTGEFQTPAEIENVVIRANDVGNWLRVKDVAEVKDTFEEEDTINKCNGSRCISLVVSKKENGDAIDIVDSIKEESAAFKLTAPDLNISFVDDLSYYIRRRLNVLKNNGWMGIVLVLCSLFFFLNSRISIITALGIPIAFLATFCAMVYLGMSINLLSMFGLIVVLGMLVDDGIIIAENSFRYLEKGFSPEEAAIKGTTEVMKPVTATVLTTIAAFSPLLFMPGLIGKFVKDIPIVVMIALLASLFEAFVILPSHFADFAMMGKAKLNKINKTGRELFREKMFSKYLSFYTRVLMGALKRRYVVIGLLVISFILLLITAVGFMKFVLFPGAAEEFYITAEAPDAMPLELTADLVKPLEEVVKTLDKSEMDSYITQIGSTMSMQNVIDPRFKRGSNYAQVGVYLTPLSQRKRSAEEIMESLRPLTKDIQGFKEINFNLHHEGPPVGAPVQVSIRGEKLEVLGEISNLYVEYLNTIDGVKDISYDYRLGKDEMRVIVDEDMAAKASLGVGGVAASIRYAFGGGVATSIKPTKAEEEIDVRVKFHKEGADEYSLFDKIYVPNQSGDLIPLNRIAKVVESKGLEYVKHLDGKRVMTVVADVDESKITSVEANNLLQKHFKDIQNKYPDYSIKYGGETEDTVESVQGLLKAFGIAFLLIFMILSTTFRSLWQPFVVLLAIPFGLMGVVIAFFIHGIPFSFLALMGIVGLNGIVVNDSIVLVDFINTLRREGFERRTSIIEACKLRLRPVTLTTVTTVVGLMPVAYGIGGFDPFLMPMAIAISWGLLFATALTLIVIPCVYAILDDVKRKITHKSTAS